MPLQLLSPISGKNGYIEYSNTEIPIYNWRFNSQVITGKRWLSNTSNYPKLEQIYNDDSLTFSSVSSSNLTTFLAALKFGNPDFKVGWKDFSASRERYMLMNGKVETITTTIKYTADSGCNVIKEATVCVSEYGKVLSNDPLSPYIDLPECGTELCNLPIETTDTYLNPGIVVGKGVVKYVKEAVITEKFKLVKNVLSYPNSMSRYVLESGVKDIEARLTIQGDFDYWIDSVNTNAGLDFDYIFNLSPTEIVDLPKMTVTRITDYVMNVETGEIVSFVVNLEKNNGS